MKCRIGAKGGMGTGGGAILGLVAAFFCELPAAHAVETSEKAESRHGAAFVDPLGFLLFGPTLGAEVAVGSFSATLYGRWFNAGFLGSKLFLNEGDEFAFSYGAGLRGRYYSCPRLTGFFLGISAEYLRSSIEKPSALIVTK